MKNLLELIATIILLFCLNISKAQVGDICSDPVIVNFCTSSLYPNNYYDHTNNVSNWNVGSSIIHAPGRDIFYQLNLPANNFQPVSIDVKLTGYHDDLLSGRIYFLWFDNPSCNGNPSAVDSFNTNGNLNPYYGIMIADSFCFSHQVTATQSQYYLAVDFKNTDVYYSMYHYTISFGFTNNQPPSQIICGPGVPPYKGKLKLDQSVCFDTTNAYHLPLSILNDDPFAPNHLFPDTLNQNLNFLPITDMNALGFSITLKNQINGAVMFEESYETFNSFYYDYSTYWQSLYTIAFTLILKNDTGAQGLKGFRMQFPDLIYLALNSNDPPHPNDGDTGFYNNGGQWNIEFSGNNTITWLFNSSSNRGDNVSDTGYSCRVYNFSIPVGQMSTGFFAWYLPDDYGSDSMECEYVPGRTDCENSCANWGNEDGWILIDDDGSGNGFVGIPCEESYSTCVGGYETTCGNFYFNSCGIGYPYGSQAEFMSFDNGDCPTHTSLSWEVYGAEYLAPQIPDGTVLNETICNGDSYNFDLGYNPNYSYFGKTILVYFNTADNHWHPVSEYGTIDPMYVYPNGINYSDYMQLQTYGTTSIPLYIPGTYNLWSYYPDSYNYYIANGENCNGTFILTVDAPVVLPSVSVASIPCGQSLNISATGCIDYLWSPDLFLNTTIGSAITVTPTSNTTYTVIGTDDLGCTDDANVVIITTSSGLDASFTILNSRYCPTSPAVILNPVIAGGIFSGVGVTGNVFNPADAGIGGPYIISYSLSDCDESSQITSVENPSADINPSAPVVEACFGQAIPLTTPYDPYYSYLWKRGPFIMPGVISNTYTPNWSGTFKYTVKVTDTYGGGCVAKDSVYYHLINFPNPTLVVGPCINNTILLTSSVTDPNLNYQWVKWGTPINGATNTTYTVTTNGGYRLAITDSCGTLRFTPLTQFTVSTCRTEEISDEQASQLFDVTLYPNPNEGQFTIDFIAYDFYSTEISLDIFNVLGQIVYTKVLNMNDGKLNAMIQLPFNIESGLYNVRIKKGDAETFRKIVLTK